MKTLTIEWKHLERDGRTCRRCGDTGDSVREVVRHLNRHCRPKGTKIQFREIKLPAGRVKESNLILFNGVPLEKVLGDTKAGENKCGSCSDLLAAETQCRTISHGGKTHEAIPSQLILRAACQVLECACCGR